jgi:hypothetical protein
MRIAYKIMFGIPEGHKLLGYLDGRTILKLILEKYGVRSQNGFKYLRIRPNSGVYEHSNKALGVITQGIA